MLISHSFLYTPRPTLLKRLQANRWFNLNLVTTNNPAQETGPIRVAEPGNTTPGGTTYKDQIYNFSEGTLYLIL